MRRERDQRGNKECKGRILHGIGMKTEGGGQGTPKSNTRRCGFVGALLGDHNTESAPSVK